MGFATDREKSKNSIYLVHIFYNRQLLISNLSDDPNTSTIVDTYRQLYPRQKKKNTSNYPRNRGDHFRFPPQEKLLKCVESESHARIFILSFSYTIYVRTCTYVWLSNQSSLKGWTRRDKMCLRVSLSWLPNPSPNW